MRIKGRHWVRWRTGTAFVAALFASSALFAAPVIIKDVRLSAGPDSTRIVFDVSARLQPTVSVLHDPERVVIDLPNAQFKSGATALPDGQGLARSLRTSPRDNGGQRVVIDVSQAVETKSFLVPPSGPSGHRVVLDLLPSAATVVASAVPAVPAAPKAVKSVSINAERDIVIAIDAGHGGEDPGATGRRGTREKDVTLAIARRLKERIDREPGMRAMLTRDGDYFLPLRDRINRARKQQADMFVSVHADAVRDRSVRGSSVYVLSPRGGKQ